MLRKTLLALALTIFSVQALSMEQADSDYVYLFGYGSLMLTPARTATSPDPEDAVYLPVKIRGVARLWNLWMTKSQQRSLDVEPADNPDSYVNGLLFAVRRDQLSAFDKREGPAYQRLLVPAANVEFYQDEHRQQISDHPEIYFYSPRKEPSFSSGQRFYFDQSYGEMKIAMSYLNVVRAGCVEIDRKNKLNDRFIDDCVKTLGLDNYQIENDLEQPKYSRYPITMWQKAVAEGNEEKAAKLQLFIEQEWQNYLQVIAEKWGF